MESKVVTGITPSKSLNWIYRKTENTPVYPPAAADVDGEYFQLNTFDIYSSEFYLCSAESIEDALNKSVSLYGAGSLNTVELANLTAVCDRLGIEKKEIEAFRHHGIKGAKNFETLKSITGFCPVMQRYFSVKPIPLKTIAVFDKLSTDYRRFVKNTVDGKELSVQDFRKMVNLLFDMQSSGEAVGPDLLKRLAEKKDMTRLSFMKELQNLTSGIPAEISSASGFETEELTVSFKVSSPEEFAEKTEKLRSSTGKIEKLYRFLNEQNIY